MQTSIILITNYVT